MALAVLLALAVSAAAASLLLFVSQSGEPSGPPRAVIVDQLSLTFPNPAFRQEATALLEQAGYEVDYFPGEEVTVDFFRYLPKQHYQYVLLRLHSTATVREGGQATATGKAFLFTGEPYSRTKYLDEQRAKYLAGTHHSPDDPKYYFGIGPEFIRDSMKGDFDGATVVVMGCDGLTGEEVAAAFVQKGAKAVIGWSGGVSADHTDAATERLLSLLLVDHVAIREAVAQVMAEVGPDPSYGSKLLLYPAEAAASGAP